LAREGNLWDLVRMAIAYLHELMLTIEVY